MMKFKYNSTYKRDRRFTLPKLLISSVGLIAIFWLITPTLQASSEADRIYGLIEIPCGVVDGKHLVNKTIFFNKKRADYRGGEIEARVRQTSKGTEEVYNISWSFDRDIRRIRPASGFNITLRNQLTHGYTSKSYTLATGSAGTLSYLLHGRGIKVTTTYGSTDRVHDRKYNDLSQVGSKTSWLHLWELASGPHAYFMIQIYIFTEKGTAYYEVIYLYKEGN